MKMDFENSNKSESTFLTSPEGHTNLFHKVTLFLKF